MARKTPAKKNNASSHPTGSRRQQLAAQTAQAERDRKIRSRIRLGLILAAVLAVVFAGVWIGTSALNSRQAADSGATPEGGTTIGVGQESAPVRVDVYQDYMCPYCGRFEQANGEALAQLVDQGTVRMEIHPMSFLDSASQGSRYSTRSANAFVTAAMAQPEHALDFNAALYANQPAEGSRGLTDEQIAQLALGVGIDQAVVDSFPDMQYERWVKNATNAAFDDGVTGTPTVRIDGETFEGDLYSPGPLEAAIVGAAND